MRQLLAVMKKEIKHLRRDLFMLRILIIAPVVQLLILGCAVTLKQKMWRRRFVIWIGQVIPVGLYIKLPQAIDSG